jgi:hypothetical protein
MLIADSPNLFTTVFPWVNYKYKRLPMGIKVASDVFKNDMSKLFQGMEYVKTTMLS